MADSAQDKHLPASQRKLKKAREDGQVARSRDLGHFAAIAAAGLLLAAMAGDLAGWLKNMLATGLQFDARLLAQPDAMGVRLGELALKMVWIVLSCWSYLRSSDSIFIARSAWVAMISRIFTKVRMIAMFT